jgi:hypothetical protein
VKFLVNRIQNYPISEDGKKRELTTIQHILDRREYQHDYRKTTFRNHTNKFNTGGEEQSKKWTTFTYIGEEARRTAKIFKNTNIRIAFKTNITIERNKKFWKELICLLSLHYLKMSFELKPAFAPT